MSYSVAAFPTLARLFAGGKHSVFANHIELALRHIIFWSVPATVFVIILRTHIVRIILDSGAFNWGATRLTAAALALFILSLVAQSGILLITRDYYAAGRNLRPFIYGVTGVLVSVGSAVALVVVFNNSISIRTFTEVLLRVENVPGTAVLMLALGLTIGSITEFLVGITFFARDLHLNLRLGRLCFESVSATIIGGSVAYQTLRLFNPIVTTTTLGILMQGIVAGVAGITVVIVVLALLHSRELAEVIGAFKRRFVDAPDIVVESTDISSVQ